MCEHTNQATSLTSFVQNLGWTALTPFGKYTPASVHV
jgi:hypothetical protein